MSDKIESPCGCMLTPEQARTVAARLTASMRQTRSGGAKITCDCGTCRTCYQRAYKRKQRAAVKK